MLKKIILSAVVFLVLYCSFYALMAKVFGYTPLRIHSKVGDYHYDYTPAWLCGKHDRSGVKVWPSSSTVDVNLWYYVFIPMISLDRTYFHPDGPASDLLPDPVYGVVTKVSDKVIEITLPDSGGPYKIGKMFEFIVISGDHYICKVRVTSFTGTIVKAEVVTESMNTAGRPIRIGDSVASRLW